MFPILWDDVAKTNLIFFSLKGRFRAYSAVCLRGLSFLFYS